MDFVKTGIQSTIHNHSSTLSKSGKRQKTASNFIVHSSIFFKKAYDFIDRNSKENGIKRRIFQALQAIYSSVQSCIKLNNSPSDWLDVS